MFSFHIHTLSKLNINRIYKKHTFTYNEERAIILHFPIFENMVVGK